MCHLRDRTGIRVPVTWTDTLSSGKPCELKFFPLRDADMAVPEISGSVDYT